MICGQRLAINNSQSTSYFGRVSFRRKAVERRGPTSRLVATYSMRMSGLKRLLRLAAYP